MRSPRTWNDTTILNDEPFLSSFTSRCTEHRSGVSRNKVRLKKMDEDLAADILRESRGRGTVKDWLGLVFSVDGQSYGRPPASVKANNKTGFIFVRCFWLLYQGQEAEAYCFLGKALTDITRDHIYLFSYSPRGETTTRNSLMTTRQGENKTTHTPLPNNPSSHPVVSTGTLATTDDATNVVEMQNNSGSTNYKKRRQEPEPQHPNKRRTVSSSIPPPSSSVHTNVAAEGDTQPKAQRLRDKLQLSKHRRAKYTRRSDTGKRKEKSPTPQGAEISATARDKESVYTGEPTSNNSNSLNVEKVGGKALLAEKKKAKSRKKLKKTKVQNEVTPTIESSSAPQTVGKEMQDHRVSRGMNATEVENITSIVASEPPLHSGTTISQLTTRITKTMRSQPLRWTQTKRVEPVPIQTHDNEKATPVINLVRYRNIYRQLKFTKNKPSVITPPGSGVNSNEQVQELQDVNVENAAESMNLVGLNDLKATLELPPAGKGTTALFQNQLFTPPPSGPPSDVDEVASEVKPMVVDRMGCSSGTSSLDEAANFSVAYAQAKLLKRPPIWAKTRQEVCETFDWFRSYQGGVYHVHEVARGYLLGAFPAKRDIFCHGGKLIISHGGGGAESMHMINGHAVLHPAEDQRASDKSVRALLRNYHESRPLVLLIDDRYAKFPFDLGSRDVTYAVLGFYMIVQAWAEYEPASNNNGQVVKYKFAFQWCEGQGGPWWHNQSQGINGLPTPLSTSSASETFDEDCPPVKVDEYNIRAPKDLDAVSIRCNNCNEDSPLVYRQGWACLNPECPLFWRCRKGEQDLGFLPEVLDYQTDFLKMMAPCYLPLGLESLKPIPITRPLGGFVTTRAFTRGFHCSECGRLSCRIEWRQWKCSTEDCGSTHRVSGVIHNAKTFWHQPKLPKFRDHWLEKDSGIKQGHAYNFFTDNDAILGRVESFMLPFNRGFVHHIQACSPFSKADAGEIFKLYQEEADSGQLNFRRWPMRSHKCRGDLLTNYFSHNAGEPYHYVGGTANTVPFEDAPSAVLKARDLIQTRIHQALGRRTQFNEVLSAAYMEKQKMAFHSDDEVGLGPLVAGLSLGSPAMMHFRLQRRHDPERVQRGVVLSFALRHGDILVMDGAGVQEYYEHTVVPTNFRIAATARLIRPQHTGSSQIIPQPDTKVL